MEERRAGLDDFNWAAFVAPPRPSEREALRELVALRATLERIEALLVAQARRNGATWETVGDALGVTRQSAHRRHRRRTTTPPSS